MADAIARVEGRFGTHVLAHGAVTERRATERRIQTDSSLDALTPGLSSGAPLAFIGTGSTGKVALAHRAAAGAQRALFHFAALGSESHDLGMQRAFLEKTG